MKIKYHSIEELVDLANQENKTISALVLENQAEELGKSEEEVYETMRLSFEVMKEAIEEGIHSTQKSSSGLSGGSARRLKERVDANENIFGPLFGNALVRSMAVMETNACMGKIVAAPTAGSCGVLPAALITMIEEKHQEERKVIMSMFTASAIGMVIARNASISGAEGGCQAEVGSASAMAAGAMVEMVGGTPTMVAHSVAIAIKNILGLVCDPVAGLVEVPCVKRNAMGIANAFVACELASAGIESAIPADEVILAMRQVGHLMAVSLKETAEGGLATTPTGKKICQRVFSQQDCTGCKS